VSQEDSNLYQSTGLGNMVSHWKFSDFSRSIAILLDIVSARKVAARKIAIMRLAKSGLCRPHQGEDSASLGVNKIWA
jgi:hypothetical protein